MADYCGPQRLKALSWIIPDKPFDVDLQWSCMIHDMDHEKNGANKAGDEKLRKNIKIAFKEKGKPKRGFFISNLYYFGVRIGSPFYKIGKWFKKL